MNTVKHLQMNNQIDFGILMCSYIYIYNFFISPMREKSKYFKMNRSTNKFVFRLFVFLQHMFLTFKLSSRSKWFIFMVTTLKTKGTTQILKLFTS